MCFLVLLPLPVAFIVIHGLRRRGGATSWAISNASKLPEL
jgi:hypothetical protein